MKENQLTKQDIRDLLEEHTQRTIKPLIKQELAEHTEQTIKPVISEALAEHTEQVIKPLIKKELANHTDQIVKPLITKVVKASSRGVVSDISLVIDNFVSSTDGRFTAIEYDLSKNKQDIIALNKTANLAFYKPR